MRKMLGKRDDRGQKKDRMIFLVFLQQWHKLTVPTFPASNLSFKQREILRQGYLTSTILLLSILVLLSVVAGAILDKNRILLFILLFALVLQGMAAWLNRQGKVTYAGLLIVGWFMMGLSIFLFTSPGQLDIASQTNFYLPIEIELLAVSLLPAWSVFPITLYNSLLIEMVIVVKPHTRAFNQLFALSGYQISLQPILLQIIVAVVSYLWVQSAIQAIQRADRAEEIARLTRTIAEQNQQRMEALQIEQEMKRAYEHQRKLNTLKDQFLINVSHELRTPLTSVEGYLELLKDHYQSLDATSLALFINKAVDSCENLTSLVNRVVEAIYINEENLPIQSQWLPIKKLVEEIVSHLDPREVTHYNLQIQIADDILVKADPNHFQQILYNLLSNTFKYAPRGTHINIEARQDGPALPVTISIQDEGPGIPPEELPLLFEKFVRLKRDQAGTTRGMGLGLYISKQLVEAMGGQMWVESTGREKEGSCFYFTLPGGNQQNITSQ